MLRHISLHAGIGSAEADQRLRDQMTQIGWSGELEGWLGPSRKWTLVSDPSVAAEWVVLLQPLSETPVATVAPATDGPLAALTAKRVVESGAGADLLPAEYGERYRQQFVDQFWMRGLGAIIGLYLVGLLVYFAAVGALYFQNTRVESQYAPLGLDYTNAVKMSERVNLLEEQVHLKYAALDCWKLAAELLPKEMTLTSLTLERGKTLRLYGTVPQESSEKIIDYNEALSKATVNAQPITVESPNQGAPRADGSGVSMITWNFACHIGKGDGK
jgi:hypothetical protein